MRFIGKHYEGIHKVKRIGIKQLSTFKEILKDKKCDIFSKISVIQRIGSDSLYATIWEADVNLFPLSDDLDARNTKQQIKMAIKVQRDSEKTFEEININKFLNDYPEYFLQMYGSVYCENISLMDTKNPVPVIATFSGDFIFMELAIADLAQLLTFTKVSERDLLTMISQVFDSIYVMGKLQLFHGDLHIRNIFIVSRANTIRAVIGDFGESIGIDSITSHTSDIYRFCTSLSEFLSNKPYPNVRNKLATIVKYVNRLTPKLENDYDIFNEENRNEDGNIDLKKLDEYFDVTIKNTIVAIQDILEK